MTPLVLLLAAQILGGPEPHTEEGARRLAAGELEEALQAFSRALEAHPESPENSLNIAGVHYRMAEAEGNADPLAEAVLGYRAALDGADGIPRRDAFFNLGNALFRGGAFGESAAAYAEAVLLDPEDTAARQNLEIALRRQREQEQGGEEPAPPDQEDGQDEGRQEEQPDAGQGQADQGEQGEPDEGGQGEPDEGQGGDGDQGEEPDTGPEQQRSSAGERPESGRPDAEGADEDPTGGDPGRIPEFSPEQAERILAALAEIERQFQEDRLKANRVRAVRRGRH